LPDLVPADEDVEGSIPVCDATSVESAATFHEIALTPNGDTSVPQVPDVPEMMAEDQDSKYDNKSASKTAISSSWSKILKTRYNLTKQNFFSSTLNMLILYIIYLLRRRELLKLPRLGRFQKL